MKAYMKPPYTEIKTGEKYRFAVGAYYNEPLHVELCDIEADVNLSDEELRQAYLGIEGGINISSSSDHIIGGKKWVSYVFEYACCNKACDLAKNSNSSKISIKEVETLNATYFGKATSDIWTGKKIDLLQSMFSAISMEDFRDVTDVTTWRYWRHACKHVWRHVWKRHVTNKKTFQFPKVGLKMSRDEACK